MIIRIVHLFIRPAEIDIFTSLFERSKSEIGASPGCLSLSLLQDVALPGHFSTLSSWETEDALNDYRSSEFFRKTWAETKPLFEDRASAHSYEMISTID